VGGRAIDMRISRSSWIGLGAGVLATPAALLVAIGSMGAGHGHYVAAKALFPHTMLLTQFVFGSIALPLIGLAIVQFSLYGWFIGAAPDWRARVLRTLTLAATHAVATAAVFILKNPSFS
jgi:hypothetical protein